MSGRGDTPVSNTFVAIYDPGSLSVGQFYVGKIEGNTLKYYGSTANDEIIVVDSNGQKVSNAVFDQSLGNTLFQKVKEVYTDISNDEIIDFTLAQGETIPDWSEYVQIGDTPEETLHFKIKNLVLDQNIIAEYGTVSKNLLVGVSSSDQMYIIDDTGKVLSSQGPKIEVFDEQLKTRLSEAGYEVNSTGSWTLDLQVGSQIENWDSYISV